jgi:hypothetical protein
MTPEHLCSNCRHAVKPCPLYAECHRRAPVSDPQNPGQARWPMVMMEDTCGEWEPDEATEKAIVQDKIDTWTKERGTDPRTDPVARWFRDLRDYRSKGSQGVQDLGNLGT